MIKKVLIANRGEIAIRIMRTCNKMGIQTVAVYSDADEHAPHTVLADEKYHIGPSPVNQSYLRSEAILEVAKQANVDAIHPGYGFLSENSNFAKQCTDAGFIFIGPSSEVIHLMGDKIAARKTMQGANVPIVPGTNHAVLNVTEAIRAANEIGYPVMLKASAGGGGIGLQIVHNDEELQKSFENTSKRAASLFNDGAMFIEKRIEHARHIEVQVLADAHGNAVHLYERECSIQRRNQKVIEETPCSFISEATREKMVDAALRAVDFIQYTNAGTIEFLVDEQEQFYFIEMNTRIQVEHAITEEVTGVDIVKEQIRIANGELLDFAQSDIEIKGHAIEGRIYAEDPNTLFPSPGKIELYEEPTGDHIRVESSVKGNMQVTPFYDAMISKVIVWADTREKAIDKLSEALTNYHIEGIKTNIPLLLHVINSTSFQGGNITTDFLELSLKNKEEL